MAKKIVSKQESELIENQAIAARELLEDERFAFVREYLESALDYIERTILENTVMEVRETHTITDKIIKTFIQPKKVQVDELSGQYKFIKKFLADMQYYADLKKQLDAEVEAKRVILND
jgi:hypothetical protein